MPREGGAAFDDNGEDYSHLLALGSPSFSPLKGKPDNCPARRGPVSPVSGSFYSSVAQQAQQVDPKQVDPRQAAFLDKYLEADRLQGWLRTRKSTFISTIFPQFFIHTLSVNFDALFSLDDVAKYRRIEHSFGDLNNSTIRERVYAAQNDYLYQELSKKIESRPSLLLALIGALRCEAWYERLADSFEGELNNWRKKTERQLSDSTPAFPLPSVGAMSLPPLGNAVDGTVGSLPASKQAQPVPVTPYQAKPSNLLFNLPEPISFFQPRSKKSQDLMDQLRALSKKGHGWLVLHGMGGSGKTTLAASTVRALYKADPTLFSDGIFWLSIGNLNEKSGSVSAVSGASSPSSTSGSSQSSLSDQQNQLLLRMELFAELLRPFDGLNQFSSTKFDQLPTAIYRLKRHFEQRRRALLILDDVWSTEVVEQFQLHIPVLVTTREASICPRAFHNVTPVSILSKGSGDVLEMNESMPLLYRCLNPNSANQAIRMEHLQGNFYVKEIIKSFNGLPFTLPLIANCMEPFYADFANSDAGLRWRLEKVADDDYNDEDSTMTPCFEQWKTLYGCIVREGSPNQTATDNLVKASIDSLDQELKERLYDFVIFLEAVPFAVFRTLWWDLTAQSGDIKIMEILTKLVSKSLVIKTVFTGSTLPGATGSPRGAPTAALPGLTASFTLHNITLTFLRNELSRGQIQTRHNKLIEAYLQRYCRLTDPSSASCTYDYARLPNDAYIYHNLAYHLYSAQRWALFAPIFLNLRFAAHKIAFVGPSDLLNDYIDFHRYFERPNTGKLVDYQSFIASNSNILCEPNVDILQIALCQPDSSAVFTEAASLVRQSGSGSCEAGLKKSAYFDWTNKANCSMEAPPKIITFRCLPDVAYATYSPDSHQIATVSGRSLQMWNGTTGEMVCRLDVHEDQVNQCVFSRNGQYLLTCADDGVAILWENRQFYQTAQAHSTVSQLSHSLGSLSTNGGGTGRANSSRPPSFIQSGPASFDFIDSCGPTPSVGHESPAEPSNEPEIAAQILAVQQQRRRRSSGNSGSPSGGSGSSHQQPYLTRVQTFLLGASKLKSDAVAIGKFSRNLTSSERASGLSASRHVKCGDISPDNKYVLTGNGSGHLHLWSVSEGQQIHTPLLLSNEDAESTEVDADSGRAVDCCAFSGDQRFLLGLVSSVVYIFSISDSTSRSQTDLNVLGVAPNGGSPTARGVHFRTPPQSPRLRRGKCTVSLCRKLVHPFKVYNAVFHSIGSVYYPTVFSSSDKYIFEWDLDSSKSRAGSFLDFDDDDEGGEVGSGRSSSAITLTQEKRKYSTTLSSAHSSSSHSSHLSFVAISRTGSRLAGFEHTRNEIYMWNRGDGTAGWGFGSRSPSPVSGGCCPSSTLLRCHSNIVSLCFSADEERLLGCCRSGEITVWDIGKNVQKTSIVDLKKHFSVCFSDSSNDDSVSILTIDTKGFLRLFTGLEGDEDRDFSLKLRQQLAAEREVNNKFGSLHPIPTPLRLDITSCSLVSNSEIIFGTNAGDVFYYAHSTLTRLLHGLEKTGTVPKTETVHDCEFLPCPSSGTSFFSLSDSCISFFTKRNLDLNQNETLSFAKSCLLLSDLIIEQNINAENPIPFSLEGISLDSFKILSDLSWIVFWSNAGNLFVYSSVTKEIVFSDYLNNTRITSVDVSAADTSDQRRRILIVSTTDKSILIYRITRNSITGVNQMAPGRLFPMNPTIPRSTRISPDKSFLIIGDDAGGLMCRSTDRAPLGAILWHRPDAHSSWIHDLGISPDQRYLLSASESVKLWSAIDGALLQSFMTHGTVCRLLTRFPTAHNSSTKEVDSQKKARHDANMNPQIANSHSVSTGPKVTVVTVTDASTLYILRTFN